MTDIEPSVVYREGAITAADYDEAIEALIAAKEQLEPNGNGCHVCEDNGHQAMECHHNPLVMARRAVRLEHSWRCFRCGEVFTDEAAAREHFGKDEEAPAKCETAAPPPTGAPAAFTPTPWAGMCEKPLIGMPPAGWTPRGGCWRDKGHQGACAWTFSPVPTEGRQETT